MDLRDPDLISLQEARDAVAQAAIAQEQFASYSQEQVDAVVEACAAAAAAAAESLARRAVEETGFGNVRDKTTKNRFAAEYVSRALRGMRTAGILREDSEKRILEVAVPVGVIAAVIPSTNPTSTAIYKTLIALKARNAVVLSPHPSAIACICEAAAVMRAAVASAGAPQDLIVCMLHTTLAGTQELMRHRRVGVILATGGTGLVRAAYASGKPAYGVGPGNVPAFVERTANVPKAIADIFAGKTFDYGTICSSEQAIVAEEPVREQALAECRSQGAHFLSPEEAERVGRLVFRPGTHTPNTEIVGRPATLIAEMAGVAVPPETRVLIARLEPAQVGREFPLSAEKLSPILAFYSVADLSAGIDLCRRLLGLGGLGHTSAVHSQDDAAIRRFGQAVPAFRVCVNTSAVHGSIGYSTNLFPAMTLGCGAPGGNITSDNIGPQHLMNVQRIAWESRAVEHTSVPAAQRMAGASSSTESGGRVAAATASAGGVMPGRDQIARAVDRVLTERGFTSGAKGGLHGAPTPSEIAAEIAGRLFAQGGGPDSRPANAAPSPAASAGASGQPAARGNSSAPPVEVAAFVSEADVQRAVARGEKIFIGPKTIVTPSARDLGSERNVFVLTEGPATAAKHGTGR